MKTSTLALMMLAALVGFDRPAEAARLPAHGYVCSVTYFPEVTAFSGRFGSAVVAVTTLPDCQGTETVLNLVTVGSTQVTPAKLTESALLHTIDLLQRAALEDMRVNIVYDNVNMTVQWINFFAR